MIDLHYWPTPNGKKVTILLEECGLQYKIVPLQHPARRPVHARIPEDQPQSPHAGDGRPRAQRAAARRSAVFESGAIMMYIAEKAGRFWPQDLRGKYEVTQWVMWQMANQGPKLGECGHFRRAGPEAGDQSYADPPLHRRGQPALRRAQQPPRTEPHISPATSTRSPT